MTTTINNRDAGFDAAFDTLVRERRSQSHSVDQTVQDIVNDVRARGDAALIDYTLRFDRQHLDATRMRLDETEIEALAAQCDDALLDAIDFAATRIEEFHAHQSPEELDITDTAGVRMGARWTPVDAAGLYVPGGLAAYPSSVLMNAIPARAAGVDRLVMAVPTPDGQVSPPVMAAALRAGVDEIWRIGGAQAIAALAYGTETIQPVDIIVGPGNAYVASAKKQVYGDVGIDMVAGPSEILVVADGKNDPDWIAADLLSQAEHDTNAQSILITDDADFARSVAAAVTAQIAALPRGEIAGASWRDNGAIITVDTLDAAIPLINRLAPEHLELALDDNAAEALAGKIRHAGAIFLGRYTPEAIGDYVGGPNHVLPTSRSARFSSGLNVLNFMKRTTLLSCTPAAIAAIGPAAVTLANAEGLEGHAKSVTMRLDALAAQKREAS